MAGKSGRRGFGHLRKLPSKRWQASYVGPDGARHPGPSTFKAKTDAEGWLAAEHRRVEAGSWTAPALRASTRREGSFGAFATSWLDTRELKPRTRALYASLLRNHLDPTFGSRPLTAITPVSIREWYAALGTGPTAKANAYGLLRTILTTAVDDGLLPANPARIKGAGTKKRARELHVLTIGEFNQLVSVIGERYRAMVLLGGWCGMRYGELAALRRCDLDLKHRLVRIRQAVTVVGGKQIVGPPKSDAGVRDVTIPPHIIAALKEHVSRHAAFGRDGLVFPAMTGGHMPHKSFWENYHAAAATIGRPDVRPHDLRHFGAVMAARSGATIGELQQRLGHSTAAAAIIYQSAVSERPEAIAQALSDMATGAN